MNTEPLQALAKQWRAEAVLYRRRGMEERASMVESFVAELEEAVEGLGKQTLTLTQAAEESGYTADHLGREVRSGRIPNAGRPNAPLIRRRDLPLKAPKLHPDATSEHLSSTKTEIVRSVVSSEGVCDG